MKGESSTDPVEQMTAMVQLMAAIRGEGNLRNVEPRVLGLLERLLAAEAGAWGDSERKRAEVEEALPQFDQRCRMAANPDHVDSFLLQFAFSVASGLHQ